MKFRRQRHRAPWRRAAEVVVALGSLCLPVPVAAALLDTRGVTQRSEFAFIHAIVRLRSVQRVGRSRGRDLVAVYLRVHRWLPALRACYVFALRAGLRLNGPVSLTFRIEPDGSINERVRSELSADVRVPQGLFDCFDAHFRDASFGPARARSVVVRADLEMVNPMMSIAPPSARRQ